MSQGELVAVGQRGGKTQLEGVTRQATWNVMDCMKKSVGGRTTVGLTKSYPGGRSLWWGWVTGPASVVTTPAQKN